MLSGEEFYGESGATSTEYAILVGFIGLLIVGGATIFGGELSLTFEGLASVIDAF